MAPKSNRAKDYMSTRQVTLLETNTFRDVVELMVKEKTNGAVIIDEERKVKGIISSWDLIQYIVPDYLEEDKHLAAFESPDVFEGRIKELLDHPVSKFMTKEVKTAHPEDSLMKIATLLSEFKIRQVPVVDDNNALIGYINRTDIKRAIAEIIGLVS